MKKKIAYITSGKIGLHRFTYNELKLLQENKIDFILCLTQLGTGPCMPDEKWHYIIPGKISAFFQFIKLLLNKPLVLDLFIDSVRKKMVPYFFVSMSFYKNLKNTNISSIHCQMGDDKLYIGYFLKRIMGKPLTVTVHAHELYKRKVYDKNEDLKNLYSYCDQVLTISDFNANIIKDKFGVSNDKLKVMRLFPDIDYMNLVKNKTKILIVANWAEKKGYDILLKALRNLNREDFVLWVVGETYYSENSIDVRKLVKAYNMEEKVAILGRQSSPMLDILFYSCDIFCLPSYTEYYLDGNPAEREGIPVSLMEAMAWGKPVIATRHAGNSELVDEILVEEKNVVELQQAISHLLDNKNLWKAMGESNQIKVGNRYSKANIEVLVKCINSF